MSNVYIARPEYIELIRKFARETSAKRMLEYINQEIAWIDPGEVPKLLSIIRISYEEKRWGAVLTNIILKKSLNRIGNGENSPIELTKTLIQSIPFTNSGVFRKITNYIINDEGVNLQQLSNVREMLKRPFRKRIWDKNMSMTLLNNNINRITHIKRKEVTENQAIKPTQYAKQEISFVDLYQKDSELRNAISTLDKSMLMELTIRLFEDHNYDFLVKMLDLNPEDPRVRHIVERGSLNPNPIDPTHWIWPRILGNLQLESKNSSIPDNLTIFIKGNIIKGDFDNALLFYRSSSKVDYSSLLSALDLKGRGHNSLEFP